MPLRHRERCTRVFTVCVPILVGVTVAYAKESRFACVKIDGAASDPVVQRVRSELRLLGVDVLSESPNDGAAFQCDAVVVSRPGHVVIRLSRERDGEEVRVPAGDAKRPELVALAAVELLRARVLHARTASPSSSEVAPSTSPASESSTETRKSSDPDLDDQRSRSVAETESSKRRETDAPSVWGISLGSGLLLSPGGIPPTMALLSSVEFAPQGRWYVGAHGLMTMGTTSWRASGGRLELDAQIVGASAGHSFWIGRSVVLRSGLGVSVLRAHYRTDIQSPVFSGGDGTRWAVLPRFDASASWFPHANVGLRMGGFLGIAVPSVTIPHPTRNQVVDVPGEPGGTRWARPLVLGAISLDIRF